MTESWTAGDVFFVLREEAERIFAGTPRTCEVCPKKGTIYPSDQASFKTSAAVCALNESPRIGLYMDKIHTPKDTVFEEDNIRALIELFGDVETAFEIYYDNYDIHGLPPLH